MPFTVLIKQQYYPETCGKCKHAAVHLLRM